MSDTCSQSHRNTLGANGHVSTTIASAAAGVGSEGNSPGAALEGAIDVPQVPGLAACGWGLATSQPVSMSADRSRTGAAPVPQTRVSGLTRPRLAWVQATHRRGWAAAIWLCLAAVIALPALLLVVDAMAVESGLADALAASGGFAVRQDVADVDAFNTLTRQVDGRVADRTHGALVPLGGTASVGPLHLLTVRTDPAPPALTRLAFAATYADHLAAHVDVSAGELPPEGLGGGETAVSLPQATADQLGLRLSDRICTDFTATASGDPRWCARVVALWQPRDARGPYWAGASPRLALFMGRYDLFQLARQRPPHGPSAAIRYWAAADAIGPADAVAVAGQVTALTADVRTGQRRVDTRLDAVLRGFDDQQRRASAAVHALVTLVAILGLGAVALVGGRFLETQSRELALLRARGWPRSRAWRVVFLGLGALGLTAAPAGLAVSLLAAVALGASGSGLVAQTVRQVDLPGMLVAVAAVAVATVALLAGLAARAVWDEPRPSLEARRRADARWPGGSVALLGALAGAVALALPRIPGAQAAAAAAGPIARDTLLIAPAPGVVLLAAAAVASWPPATWLPGRGSVQGALASRQLERRPGQHAGGMFVLTLATAGAVFAAIGLTTDLGAGHAALRLGVDVALVTGAGGGLLLALAAFGVHFRSTARRRLREYGGLFAHGLAPDHVASSLAAEQAVTAGAGVLAGCVLGVAMALAVLPLPSPAGAGAAVMAAATVVLGSAAIALVSRRVPTRVDPLQLQRTG
jgi:hypothetical protein